MNTKGLVRIVGESRTPGMPVVGAECRVDVCQEDGTWVQMRGVCAVRVDIAADEIVTAHLVIEPGSVEWVNAMVGGMQVAKFAGRWRRFLFWLRGLA
jgi:hypothetical protein